MDFRQLSGKKQTKDDRMRTTKAQVQSLGQTEVPCLRWQQTKSEGYIFLLSYKTPCEIESSSALLVCGQGQNQHVNAVNYTHLQQTGMPWC